jgi:hypothetical protein
MKKTYEQRLEERLRTAVFKNNSLSKSEIDMAKIFLKKTFGDNILTSKGKFKTPSTWNIKLYSHYLVLQDMLYSFDIERIFNIDEQNKLIAIVKQAFIMKSIISDNDEKKYFAVREETIKYFKEAIFQKNPHGKFIYKSNKMSIRVSFKQKTVSIKEYKTGTIYIKDIDLDELDLFPTIKALI